MEYGVEFQFALTEELYWEIQFHYSLYAFDDKIDEYHTLR